MEPEDLPDAAADEATASGAWAKVIAEFFGPGGSTTPALPADALAEAARRVHELGRRITAHGDLPGGDRGLYGRRVRRHRARTMMLVLTS